MLNVFFHVSFFSLQTYIDLHPINNKYISVTRIELLGNFSPKLKQTIIDEWKKR